MLIGILSDSHGKFDATKLASEMLRSRGARQLIHCGDVGGQAIVDLLAGDIPAAFVFGNNDDERDELSQYAESIGVMCLDNFGELDLDGKKIAVAHGDIASITRRAIASQSFDYLLVGHTHLMRDERIESTRVINPGALYRAAVKSVALLDTASDSLEFLRVIV